MIGVDIVDIGRIKSLDLTAFADKVFTPEEKSYVFAKKDACSTAAGIFAAKEAVVKALGCGFVKDVTYTDVEIVHDKSGAPVVNVKDGARKLLEEKGNTIFVSISHDGGYAVAAAIIK